MKRVFDFTVSLLLIIILSPLFLLISLIILIDAGCPVIFRQYRVGKDNKLFYIYKFRTMKNNTRNAAKCELEESESCITASGRLLRKTSLDEMPQLFNVLRGDMSFVGPRPERAYFYDEFETYIHGFRNRLLVEPGLTGWAQVNGGYDLRPEEKIIYDMEYIQSRSLWMDLRCIFKTVGLVFTHEGAR